MYPRNGAFAALAFLLSGCVSVPELEHDGVAVSEIVQRIKCELAFAVPDAGGYYPSGQFQWMKYWTAKVDLTLETTNSAGVTPNSSIIEPMAPAVLPGIGSFIQNFTLGIGANLNTTAYRNDKLSFTLSMSELADMRGSACDLPSQHGLLGSLGLQEWVSSALAPVANRQLTIGYHQPPTGKAAPLPAPTSGSGGPSVKALTKASLPSLETQLENHKAILNDAIKDVDLAERAAATARAQARATYDSARDSWRPRLEWIQATYVTADRTIDTADTVAARLDNAKGSAWKARIGLLELRKIVETKIAALPPIPPAPEKDPNAVERGQLDALQKKINAIFADKTGLLAEIASRSKEAGDLASEAKQSALAAWNLLPRDTPLDSIAHSVKFTVLASANINPHWTLARFKGPGQSVPFAFAQRQRIHNLDLVLGAPAEPGGKALSDEQRRQLINQRLDEIQQSNQRFDDSRIVIIPSQ